MPIYEYRCPDCGHEQENLIRTQDETPTCGSCGSTGLQRKLSVFAVSVAAGPGAAPECACAASGMPGCGSSGGCGHAGGCGCA